MNKFISSIKKAVETVTKKCAKVLESLGNAISSFFEMACSLKRCLYQGGHNSLFFGDYMGGLLVAHSVAYLCPNILLMACPPLNILISLISFFFSISFSYPATFFLLIQAIAFLLHPESILSLGSHTLSFFSHCLTIINLAFSILYQLLHLFIDILSCSGIV